MNDARVMFQYLGVIARREGAWVIIPKNGAVKGLPENLRAIECTVLNPPGTQPSAFGERGHSGRWMLMWVPE